MLQRKVSCWLYINFLLLLLPFCRAVLVNRTIDDSFGDPVTGFKPVYFPSAAWADQTCIECAVQPDTKSAFEGTWTAATYNPGMNDMSITLEFTGVAIWVFFILANALEPVVTNTQCNFTLDGQHAGNFIHFPDMGTSEMQYNVTSFSRSGLANETHELVISTNDYPFNAYVSFDYAIYTADVDDPLLIKATSFGPSALPKSPQWVLLASRSSSSTENVGVIVGSVLGGLALVIILVASFLICRLNQRKRTKYRPVQDRLQDTRGGNVNATHTPWQHSSHPSSEQLGTVPRVGALQIDTGSHSQPRSVSSADHPEFYSSGTSLTPVRRYQELSPHSGHTTSNQEKLRIMRQREINDRLQLAQQEMSSLASRQISPSEGSSSAGQEMASLREQVQELRDQIETLQTQRNSDWALGLTDDQPPAYT